MNYPDNQFFYIFYQNAVVLLFKSVLFNFKCNKKPILITK